MTTESQTPPWTNDRFARKQALLQESIKNPFSMTLKTFPPNKHHRLTKQPGLSFKSRSGSPCFNPLPSLEILRCTLQRRINKDIQKVFQYYSQFFQMAVDNMRDSFGPNAVTEDHLLMVFRNSLEAAKEIFTSHTQRSRSREPHKEKFQPERFPETQELQGEGWEWHEYAESPPQKRKKQDLDSENTVFSMRPASTIQTRKRKGKVPSHHSDYTRDVPSSMGTFKPRIKIDPVKREGPKWDPSRLNPDSQFVMGARANKALGLGATRGRVYIKHPELFKYSGDQDDKQWLFEHHLMPATGGKAYMLLVEDILELAQTDEYTSSGNLKLEEIRTFKVPGFMIQKIKAYMEVHRTDNKGDKNSDDEESL